MSSSTEELVDVSTFFSNGSDYNFNSTGNDHFNSTGNETSHTGDAATKAITLNFLDSFVKALSVMIVSELGDKTFFLAHYFYF